LLLLSVKKLLMSSIGNGEAGTTGASRTSVETGPLPNLFMLRQRCLKILVPLRARCLEVKLSIPRVTYRAVGTGFDSQLV
jgi:hypothetical protein